MGRRFFSLILQFYSWTVLDGVWIYEIRVLVLKVRLKIRIVKLRLKLAVF